jgi:predicted esterase YcpF (UPF0227 family)
MKNLLIAIMLLSPALSYAKVYKCTNKDTGKLVFSDVSCPAHATKEKLDIVENDYTSQKWRRVDAKIEANKQRQIQENETKRAAYQHAKEVSIARVERRNNERFRIFQSNKLRYEQHKADVRSLNERITMINAAVISRR